MPKIKSAKKALRQNITRKKRNTARKNAHKDVAKSYRKLVASGKKEEAQKLLPMLYKALDKAAKTHSIPKNKASRLKSRLSRVSGK